MKKCPFCDNEHPENAQYCPETGKVLPTQGEKSKSFYVILGGISALFMIVSLFMLFDDVDKGMPDDIALQTDDNISIGQTEKNNENILDQQIIATSVPTETQAPTLTPTATAIPYPLPVDLKINEIDGAEMVLIPAGEFLMGSNQSNDPYFWGAEAPEHTVNVGSFWIYQTEVTQSMYQKCDEQNACPAPEMINHQVALQYGNPRFSNYPVVMVTWQGALAYCQWAGGRLPTEAEWEKTARGTDGRLFPWGDDSSANGFANYSSSSPSPVGSYPVGASPYGAFDMAGNVLEWVNDYFESGYYQYSPLDNPKGPPSGSRRIIRGGAFNQEEVAGLRTVARASLRPTDTKVSVGFRCASDNPE